ncbi:MAG TPA: tRNA pseudouridine(38-40) synthase TruA [Chthoniobacterales bacterium]|nr:tRNA pseudouridine(38-40) synthase TruA [Chthoniobacterales bacterium]
MSERLKLIVAYDGSAFAGWQSQTHRNTVQDELERAIARICGSHVRIHGAGRTDTGVHALAQCAHVDLPNRRLAGTRWISALNGVLPPTIRVLRCRYVSQDFHARFSAKGKTYRYRIWAGPVLPPLEFKRAWHVTGPLDLDLLAAAGKKFVGKHDFGAFAANRGKPEEDTTRTIWSVAVRGRSASLAVEISGDGFLYKMVRLIIGSMAQVALRKASISDIEHNLGSGRPNKGRFTAPAEGLYLMRVWY